jgi:copper chaperone CopZ
MFNLFKKKTPVGTSITLKLSGLHCSSCSLNIDGEIEDLPGVFSVSTSYAQQVSVINYDPKIVSPTKFHKIIEGLGYKIVK